VASGWARSGGRAEAGPGGGGEQVDVGVRQHATQPSASSGRTRRPAGRSGHATGRMRTTAVGAMTADPGAQPQLGPALCRGLLLFGHERIVTVRLLAGLPNSARLATP
jgi:hypothetical protein